MGFFSRDTRWQFISILLQCNPVDNYHFHDTPTHSWNTLTITIPGSNDDLFCEKKKKHGSTAWLGVSVISVSHTLDSFSLGYLFILPSFRDQVESERCRIVLIGIQGNS